MSQRLKPAPPPTKATVPVDMPGLHGLHVDVGFTRRKRYVYVTSPSGAVLSSWRTVEQGLAALRADDVTEFALSTENDLYRVKLLSHEVRKRT